MNPRTTFRAVGFAALLIAAGPAIALAQGGVKTSKPTNTTGMPTTGSSSAMSTPETQTGTHMTESQITSALKAEGYTDIRNLKMTNGYYSADAKRNGTEEHNLQINASTGKVMNQQ